MYLPDSKLEEFAFAFRCYVYFRWHTFYRQPVTELKLVTSEALGTQKPRPRQLDPASPNRWFDDLVKDFSRPESITKLTKRAFRDRFQGVLVQENRP